MIGVRLNGRLGNQLFQYALAFSVAKKYNTFYIIDNDYKDDYVKKYFKTKRLFNNKLVRRFYKKLLLPSTTFVYQNNEETTEAILPLLNNHRFYYGFFQSELYFQQISDTMQNCLQVKPGYIKTFSKKCGHLFGQKKVLAIHYRLGDYMTWGNKEQGGSDLTLPESYYRNALQQIIGLDDYTILVVTDDTKNIANKLQEVKNKIIFSDDEIIDFQVLMNADTIIASNSSFCWWAAYLNKKQPTIFAPKYWLGFKVNKEMPSNIIPGKFIKVNVY